MNRRKLMTLAGGLPLMSTAYAQSPQSVFRRSRPGDPSWPSAAQWDELEAKVGGQLVEVRSPLEACRSAPESAECAAVFRGLKNPWYIGDNVALTQTSGWVDAWTSAPSAYAVAARNAADVVAAVNFARTHRLRLVVKGGGHSYQGTSNAADSLLVWTRPMDRIDIHDAFTGQGCSDAAQPAVSIGAGAVWLHAYAAVAKAGRYVQGGGCLTVGVAGLVQSGGFGSFSKRYGSAAASLIEAEVVTADGAVRIANACTNPDLFWGLKGGGGGSLGVVTRLTLRTHELPKFFGGAFGAVKATSDAAFRRLIERFVAFYRDALFNPTWGEQVKFYGSNVFEMAMIFQGIDRDRAEAAWQPFTSWIAAQGGDYTTVAAPMFFAAPAQYLWDAEFLKKNAPQIVLSDDRPGAPEGNVFWRTNQGEAGWFLHGYELTWMPASLLEPARQPQLVDALFAASRRRTTSLHFNKGLAGRAGRGGRGGARHRDQPGRRRRLRPGHHRRRGAAGLPGNRRPRTRPAARPPQCARHRRRDGRTAQAGAQPRLLRVGVELFRGRLAGRLLGDELSQAAAGQGQGGSRGTLLRPSRRRQRGLERRRFYAPEVEAPGALARWPILDSVPFNSRSMFWWWRAQTSGTSRVTRMATRGSARNQAAIAATTIDSSVASEE